MKKIFTFFAAAVVAMTAMATDYSGKITVTINDDSYTQDATITIDQNEDGTYVLNIRNFRLVTEETTIDVGNIVVDNLKGYTVKGNTTVVADQIINIQEGDDPDVEMWFGPYLEDVPIIMAAQFDATNAKADIDIDMTSTLEQFINVKFETPGIAGVYGDVDGDGTVTAGDITAIYNILLGN
ncbi:MAG: hypothetical protein IKT03_07100 [Muribaculaceae bacterium]|nr:hypothetical protein [Muribaculaceae bacterium]MBR6490282.1 hypothetical protein [Muribaculaceae bacterium]